MVNMSSNQTIERKFDKIKIRSSSVQGFFSCAYQWGKKYLEGQSAIPNSRASIGQAIHFGVEKMWSDAIKKKEKHVDLDMMIGAAVESWEKETKEGVNLSENETKNTCIDEIIQGTQTFVRDIEPVTPIPDAVEKKYVIPIKHPLVEGLRGTLDYIQDDIIADLKTSKRKTNPKSYEIQQSLYKHLANKNDHNIEHNLIQLVILKKNPEGLIYRIETEDKKALWQLKNMLDALALVEKDKLPIHNILRPNPSHIFCSEKFCAYFNECPAIVGELDDKSKVLKQLKGALKNLDTPEKPNSWKEIRNWLGIPKADQKTIQKLANKGNKKAKDVLEAKKLTKKIKKIQQNDWGLS